LSRELVDRGSRATKILSASDSDSIGAASVVTHRDSHILSDQRRSEVVRGLMHLCTCGASLSKQEGIGNLECCDIMREGKKLLDCLQVLLYIWPAVEKKIRYISLGIIIAKATPHTESSAKPENDL
jgi:hypothetical protein